MKIHWCWAGCLLICLGLGACRGKESRTQPPGSSSPDAMSTVASDDAERSRQQIQDQKAARPQSRPPDYRRGNDVIDQPRAGRP